MSIGMIPLSLIFVLTFVTNIPLPLGFFAATMSYFIVNGQDVGMVAHRALTMLDAKYIIIAVPLFVFTANIMNEGKITERVFDFANSLVGRLPGGLAHVNVIASLIFSGMTGSEVADASGLGMMEIKAMTDGGYKKDFSCAITATSATVGPIFPPSIPMVFYAMLSGASIGKLFMGGMLPGVLISLSLMLGISVIAKRRNYPTGKRYALKEFVLSSLKAFPALLTPVVLLGGLYTGVMTATEAGAIAAFYGLLVSTFVYRAMGFKRFYNILVDTVKKTGMLSLLVGSAFVFSFIVARENIPQYIESFLFNLTDDKVLLLVILVVFFLILGMFIDTSTQILIFVPMVLPIVNKMGIDLIHFGVVTVLTMMISLSTPPFGVVLFIVSGISDTPLGPIIREAVPMLIILIVVLFILVLVPDLVLFIPNTFG